MKKTQMVRGDHTVFLDTDALGRAHGLTLFLKEGVHSTPYKEFK